MGIDNKDINLEDCAQSQGHFWSLCNLVTALKFIRKKMAQNYNKIITKVFSYEKTYI